mgnify:CR=1 FL=1
MPFTGITINVASGVDLEPAFAQMPTGESARVRLARGGTWSGNYLYRQGGGGDFWHYIEADDGFFRFFHSNPGFTDAIFRYVIIG